MIGIVYSKLTGRVRWVLSPDSDAELARIQLNPGEALLTADSKSPRDLDAVQALVTAKTGITPSNDRHVIVDANNNVVGALLADPVGCGDAIPGKTLIQHSTAGIGATYQPIGKTFIAPIVAVDPVIPPQHLPGAQIGLG